MCAGINYFHTADQSRHSILHVQKKVSLVYCLLLVVNLLATCLVLSESIQTTSKLQQELVDLFLPSFFFLLGVDLLIFLPFDKIFRDIENHLNKKENSRHFRSSYDGFLEESLSDFLDFLLYQCWFSMRTFPFSQMYPKGNLLLWAPDSGYPVCFFNSCILLSGGESFKIVIVSP